MTFDLAPYAKKVALTAQTAQWRRERRDLVVVAK